MQTCAHLIGREQTYTLALIAGIKAVGKDIGGGAIGVQVRDLREVLEGFTGEVWALPLAAPYDQLEPARYRNPYPPKKYRCARMHVHTHKHLI